MAADLAWRTLSMPDAKRPTLVYSMVLREPAYDQARAIGTRYKAEAPFRDPFPWTGEHDVCLKHVQWRRFVLPNMLPC